ncbi:MAG TPA: FUSC family protein [Ideonella sp.]|nr:FUSC family protein [Ideonella sp.]
MKASAALHRLPAPLLNGLTVALGVALIQGVVSLLFGPAAGIVVASGAVCTSLPDVPNPPQRTARRMLPAAVVVGVVSLAVGVCHPHPLALGLLITLIAFLTLLCMAWGPRAGPLSFCGTLAMVFAMAFPAPDSWAALFSHTGWVLLGTVSYAGWAVFTSRRLQGQYRRLALAEAMDATVRRLRSRATLIASLAPVPEDTVRASIRDDAALAESLQAARDQLFAAPDGAATRYRNALLLHLIELRDLLLASRLDLPLLGSDAAGNAWRETIAHTLQRMADTLAVIADTVRTGGTVPHGLEVPTHAELADRAAAVPVAPDDPRSRLMATLLGRLGHMIDDVAALCTLLAKPPSPADELRSTLTHAQLQLFVSPEGWPLAAVKAHLSLRSPVFRHAVRGALALGSAYALALALPWAAHPHWLVLSVAVVLRGNLEQTLARRNDRLLGTVLGSLLLLALAQVPQSLQPHLLLSGVFVAAIGIAHAYVNQRYLVAATAATVMALLQPHLAVPGSGYAIGERLADTAIGALLAWAFCFVLPSWERRQWAELAARLGQALGRHAQQVMAWAPPPSQALAQRLSRQQAHQALAALAAAAQRSSAEPRRVRLPEKEVDALLTHGYRLLALLSMIQQTLARRRDTLDPAAAQAAFGEARQALQQALPANPAGKPGSPPADTAQPASPPADPLADWPDLPLHEAPTLWMQRRLRMAVAEGERFAEASRRLRGAMGA